MITNDYSKSLIIKHTEILQRHHCLIAVGIEASAILPRLSPLVGRSAVERVNMTRQTAISSRVNTLQSVDDVGSSANPRARRMRGISISSSSRPR